MLFGESDMISNLRLPEELHDLSIIIPNEVSWPDNKTVQELFLEVALASPEKTALVTPTECLSYGELNRRSANLAQKIINCGVLAGDIVAIKSSRNASWVVAMVAVLRADAAWLPLNPSDTSARHQYQVNDSQAVLLLLDDSICLASESTLPVLLIDDQDPLPEVPLIFPKKSGANSPAYIMYTSGSTGQPKGVVVSHRNIIRLVKNSNIAVLDDNTRLLQTGAVTFDATTFEVWGPLLNGGCLVIAEEDTHLNSEKLQREIKKHTITTMWLTSSLFNLHALETPDIFNGINELIVGGDVVLAEQVRKVVNTCQKLIVINGYGPTENTTFSTIHRITDQDIQCGRIPIGRPFSNSTTYVLDEHGLPVPRGIEGELYVGGAGVSLGYLNHAELTAKSFYPDSFVIGGRMYRTGDRAVMRMDGVLEFMGRKDRQVKIRGYRIELGEIEATLVSHQEVNESVVQVRAHDDGAKYLTAYVSTRNFIDEHSLRAFLIEKLPDYMVPNFLVFINFFPINSHGKIDLKKLPDPLENYTGAKGYKPPVSDTQKKLLTVWKKILGIEGVGIEDSLFDIGVDSLSAARLAVAINKAFGVTVKTTDILSHPTISSIAALVDECNVEQKAVFESQANLEKQRMSLTPQQYPLYVEQIKSCKSVKYNVPVMIELDGTIDFHLLDTAWKQVVKRHHALQMTFPLSDPPEQIRNTELITKGLIKKLGSPNIKELIRPFEFEKGPLWRAIFFEEKGGQWLFLDFHHLIIDGSSLSMLLTDLDRYYYGEVLPVLKKKYEDYVIWSNGDAREVMRQRQQLYWCNNYSLPEYREELPKDNMLPIDRNYAGSVFYFSVNPTRTDRLKELGRDSLATLFETLTLIYGQFLSAITGSEKVHFGIPASTKDNIGYQDTVGMFVNTVAICLSIDKKEVFKQAIPRVASQVRLALQNQDFTLYDLIQMLDPKIIPGRHPLFDSMFALQSNNFLQHSLFGINQKIKPLHTGEAMFDLNMQVYEGEEELNIEWEYSTELFSSQTMETLSKLFIEFIDSAIETLNPALEAETVASEVDNHLSLQEIEFNF